MVNYICRRRENENFPSFLFPSSSPSSPLPLSPSARTSPPQSCSRPPPAITPPLTGPSPQSHHSHHSLKRLMRHCTVSLSLSRSFSNPPNHPSSYSATLSATPTPIPISTSTTFKSTSTIHKERDTLVSASSPSPAPSSTATDTSSATEPSSSNQRPQTHVVSFSSTQGVRMNTNGPQLYVKTPYAVPQQIQVQPHPKNPNMTEVVGQEATTKKFRKAELHQRRLLEANAELRQRRLLEAEAEHFRNTYNNNTSYHGGQNHHNNHPNQHNTHQHFNNKSNISNVNNNTSKGSLAIRNINPVKEALALLKDANHITLALSRTLL